MGDCRTAGAQALGRWRVRGVVEHNSTAAERHYGLDVIAGVVYCDRMRRTTIYIRELDLHVARWEPGVINFVRWLFTPFQPPPVLPEISLDDEPEIKAYLERKTAHP